MVPIYFPFTWISSAELDAIKTYFNRCVIYQPAAHELDNDGQTAESDESLVYRFPVSGDEEALASAINNYLSWADLHQGASLTALNKRLQKIPFFDDASVSQLKASIKYHHAGMNNEPTESDSRHDAIFNARLFLYLAQAYDKVNSQLYQDLRKIENMEQGLMNSLAGISQEAHDEHRDAQPFSEKDHSIILESKRLAAWSLLFGYDSDPSGLFVTCSATLFNLVIEQCPTAEKVVDLQLPSIQNASKQDASHWQKQLIDSLERLAASAWPAELGDAAPSWAQQDGEPEYRLKVYISPNDKPEAFWRSRFLTESSHPSDLPVGSSYANTLIGLIDVCH
jgi:hypothetical protein